MRPGCRPISGLREHRVQVDGDPKAGPPQSETPAAPGPPLVSLRSALSKRTTRLLAPLPPDDPWSSLGGAGRSVGTSHPRLPGAILDGGIASEGHAVFSHVFAGRKGDVSMGARRVAGGAGPCRRPLTTTVSMRTSPNLNA
jgi:hypothetical protein